MDSQTSTLNISAVSNPLADLVVPSTNAALLRGLPFNVDATKSSFKMTSISANAAAAYDVWFQEMADVDPIMVEDTTEGLVRRGLFTIAFFH